MRVKEGNSENVLRMVPGDFKYIANAKYKCHIHIFFYFPINQAFQRQQDGLGHGFSV